MKKIFYYVRSVNLVLTILVVAAIISIIIMEGWLLDIPEIVTWGSEFGSVYYKLCIAMISSYIFYFIVVHLKNMRDKEWLDPVVSRHVAEIVGNYKFQIRAIKHEAGIDSEKEYFIWNDDKARLIEIFSKVKTKGKTPLINDAGVAFSWLEFLHLMMRKTMTDINFLLEKIQFLDSELVNILSLIQYCEYFQTIDLIVRQREFENEDLSFFGELFYMYGTYCAYLETYAIKNFSNQRNWSRYGGKETIQKDKVLC